MVPLSAHAADTASAYCGPTRTMITVVRRGPVTKISSIITESSAYAPLSSSGEPARRLGQRERRTEESGGSAAPVTNDTDASSATPAEAAPSVQTSTSPAACTTASGSSTPSPRWSTSLPWNGAPSALPSASAPAHAPAAANEPVVSST